MSRLDFSVADLNLPATRDKTRRASISGVQDKVQLKRVRGKYVVVDSGGDYILKPVPRNTSAELASDIPANEAVTMDIAGHLFGIKVAEHELVEMKDGEKAYLTRRFDRRGGEPILQEDFCQLAGRSPETHGENYKYDASYEDLAELVRRFAHGLCRLLRFPVRPEDPRRVAPLRGARQVGRELEFHRRRGGHVLVLIRLTAVSRSINEVPSAIAGGTCFFHPRGRLAKIAEKML